MEIYGNKNAGTGNGSPKEAKFDLLRAFLRRNETNAVLCKENLMYCRAKNPLSDKEKRKAR